MTFLFVCSGGGHLEQLQLLSSRILTEGSEVVWATFDTPLSRSVLKCQDALLIPYSRPRSMRDVARNAFPARRLLRERRIDAVVSTGANPALSFFLPATIHRIPCHYIESATRTRGPSATGRIVRWLPGVALYTQSCRWESKRWEYVGSVFDAFHPVAADPRAVRKVVVTLGTTETYGFRSLIERLLEILPDDADVLWQTGATDTSGLPIRAQASVPRADLDKAIRLADVVVAHAGTGSALTALQAGRCPMLVARSAQRGEHVDDHQSDTAAELATRRLAVVSSLADLTFEALERAAATRVSPSETLPRIRLRGVS